MFWFGYWIHYQVRNKQLNRSSTLFLLIMSALLVYHTFITFMLTILVMLSKRSACPVKNLSSQLTHCKLTWNLTASSFWSHSSTLQHTQEMISQLWPSCEWVLREFASPTLSLLWPISEINHLAHQAVVAVWTQWSVNLMVRHSGESTVSMR